MGLPGVGHACTEEWGERLDPEPRIWTEDACPVFGLALIREEKESPLPSLSLASPAAYQVAAQFRWGRTFALLSAEEAPSRAGGVSPS